MYGKLYSPSTQVTEESDYSISSTEDVYVNTSKGRRSVMKKPFAEKSKLWRMLNPIRKTPPKSTSSSSSKVLFSPRLSFDSDSDDNSNVCIYSGFEQTETSSRVVRFDMEIQYEYTLNRIDYTDDEIKTCWIDEKFLEQSIAYSHMSIENVVSQSSECCSIRGVEMIIEEGKDSTRQQNRNDGFIAVLGEQ